MGLTVATFFDEATNTATHVASDAAGRACAIIDSVLDFDQASGRTSVKSADRIIKHVRENGLEAEWILETHVHADHLSAAPYLKQQLGGRIGIGANITIVQDVFGKIFNAGTEFERSGSQFDALFQEGDTLAIGTVEGRVLHTPGHTPACMTFVFGELAFVGDTLFMPDYGTARADFPGGDARMLFRSIHRVLALPPQTRLFLCHDYKAPGRTEFCWETTVEAERTGNVHIKDGVGEEEFATMRNARDKTLPMPRLIIPSIQVNMRAGHLPVAEDNGTRYLKVPLDVL